METQETIICRLCLTICDSFKALEGEMKDALDIVFSKLNLAAVNEPVMCTNCAEVLVKCFDFKTTCFYTRDYIVPFVKNENTAKLDLLDVYLSKNENGTGIPDDQDICAFCTSPTKKCLAISLEGEERDIILENMIKLCIPELDLSIIKKPIICAPCHGSLENCFRFVTNCLIVEDKIKKYCETLDINSESQIDLSNLLQFTLRDVNTAEVDGDSVDINKVEEQFCEESENADEEEIGNKHGMVQFEQSFCDVENAEQEVEYKSRTFMDMHGMKLKDEEQFTPKNMSACNEESNNPDVIKTEETFCGEIEIKEENLGEMEDQKCLFNEEIEIKTDKPDFHRLEDGVVPQQEVLTELCSRGEFSMPNVEGDQKLKTHSRLRKNSSEISMYRCGTCSYQTKHKHNAKLHSLVHKDPSEVTMYQCDYCSLQTKYKTSLKKHLLTHKNPAEVTMHKCASGVKMYKCESCSFQTKTKYSLKLHFRKHKDPLEVAMYKCDSCSFQTKFQFAYRSHMLTHNNPSELTIHKCDTCSYQTKFEYRLKNHLHSTVHKVCSGMIMYKCDQPNCPFETSIKHSHKMHLAGHADHSEVISYQTERKRDLNLRTYSRKRNNI